VTLGWTERNSQVRQAILDSLDRLVPEENRPRPLGETPAPDAKIKCWVEWLQPARRPKAWDAGVRSLVVLRCCKVPHPPDRSCHDRTRLIDRSVVGWFAAFRGSGRFVIRIVNRKGSMSKAKDDFKLEWHGNAVVITPAAT